MTVGELLRLAGSFSFDDGHHSQAQRLYLARLYEGVGRSTAETCGRA